MIKFTEAFSDHVLVTSLNEIALNIAMGIVKTALVEHMAGQPLPPEAVVKIAYSIGKFEEVEE